MENMHRIDQVLRHVSVRRALLLGAILTMLGTRALAQQLFAPTFASNPVTSVVEDTQYTYSVTVFDLDLLDTIAIRAPTKPDWLELIDHGNRTATLAGTPNESELGPHSVVLEAFDGANTTLQSFTVTVTAAPVVNQPPVITGQATPLSTPEETSLTITLAALVVTDPDDDYPEDFTLAVQSGANYTRSGNTITPNADFTGALAVPVRVNDGSADSNTFNLTVTVTDTNAAPVATADAYSTAEDVELNVSRPNGVLANDTDADGDVLDATLVAGVAHGSLTLRANGSFAYVPSANFNGADGFTYQARDGAASSNTATVTINVTARDDPPIAIADSYSTAEDTTLNVAAANGVLANDTDPDTPRSALTASLVRNVAHGTLSLSADGSFVYTPAANFSGADDFTYRTGDGSLTSAAATVTIAVSAAADAPAVAPIPPQTATEAAPFSLNLAQFVTDSDTPATALVYAATSPPPTGLALAPNGVLSGTPALGTAGESTVRFTVGDGTSTVAAEFRLTVVAAGTADLALDAAAAPNPAPLNTTATWTFTIANNSALAVPSASLDALFTGAVPFRFDAPPSPACTLTPTGNDTQLLCTLGPIGGSATTSIAVMGSGAFAGDVFVSARVAINGAPVDSNSSNDAATASLTVAGGVSGPAQTIAGIDARAVATGDLNGDGFDDLALAAASAQGALVLLNIVDPASSTKRALATTPLTLGGPASATGVAIADFDQDTDLDIVATASTGAPTHVYSNTGAAAFVTAMLDDAQEDRRAVAAADLNGDGFPDLVFANAGTNRAYINQGGSFSAGQALGSHDSRAVAIADLFGDALPEVVFANGSGDAAIYRNDGGTLTFAQSLTTGPASAVAAADVNNDGRMDLVVGRSSAAAPSLPTTLVWLNTSGASGGFFLADELGPAATIGVSIADFDLDRDLDISTVNANGAHQIHSNSGSAAVAFVASSEPLGFAGARMAAHGRLSVDERVDLALAGAGGVAIFYNDGSGRLGAGDASGPTIQLRGEPSIALTVGDTYTDAGATATDAVDGDVTSRIVVTNPVDPAVVGTYTVAYDATDVSGNPAQTVARTVRVEAREGTGGGGGGAVGIELVLLAFAALALRSRGRNRGETSIRA